MTAPTTENVRLYKDRADAATRLLERRRDSIELAIQALEIVGYKVYWERNGGYRVEPPHDKISKFEAVPTVKPTPEAKAKFLEDYPPMLTVRDVSEIMGFSEGAIRRLCKEDKIPNMKMGGRIRIPKKFLLDSFDAGGSPEKARWRNRRAICVSVCWPKPENSLQECGQVDELARILIAGRAFAHRVNITDLPKFTACEIIPLS